MGVWEFVLECKEPYSFSLTTKRLKSIKSFYCWHDGAVYRAFWFHDSPIVLGVRGTGQESKLIFQVHGQIPQQKKQDFIAHCQRMWSTEVDLQPLYDRWQEDKYLGPILKERRGMHLVLEPSLFECLIKTIIGQQLNLRFAATLERRLVDLAGEKIEFAGKELLLFPKPEQIAKLDYADLRNLQFNQRKAEYIIDLSRKVASGELDLDELKNLGNEEILQKLSRLRGIGRWTVECFLLFGLGRPNLLPAADIGLKNALRKLYQWEAQPTEAEVRKIGQEWSPFESYITFYLWDYLNNEN